MKISQYILPAFLGFVFTATLVLFADSKNAEKINVFGATIPEKNLEAFSVIVAENEANITIKNDSVNTMSALLFKTDSVSELPKYKIANDTLFVSKSGYNAKTVIKCHGVKTIIGRKKSNINLDNYTTDSLSLRLNKSRVSVWNKNISMAFINVVANDKSNLTFYINNSRINQTKLKVDNSVVSFSNKSLLNRLTAVLTSKSNMRVGKVEKLKVDCDNSSKYWVSN